MSNSSSSDTMQPTAAPGKPVERIVDSHIHLDQIDDAHLDRTLLENESYGALIPGISPDQFLALQKREELARFDCAIGWHPWYLPDAEPTEQHGLELSKFADAVRVTAYGETGLDALVADSQTAQEHQERWFAWQICLAKDLGLPLVVHCVHAHGRCWEMLRKHDAREVGGVIHAYSSSPEMARQYQDLGFAVGIGSPVTREQSRRVRESASTVADDWLLLETDAPYMNVGTRPKGAGTAANIATVTEVVATLRQTDQKTLQRKTAQNFDRIFRRESE